MELKIILKINQELNKTTDEFLQSLQELQNQFEEKN